jgi:hypothetical protein
VASEKPVPAWVWVGCGCLGAIGVLVLLLLGVGFWGFQKARELGETMANPEERTRQALEMLGTDTLPEGYHAVMEMSVPLVFEIALLSNAPPDADFPLEVTGSRGFVYMVFPSFNGNDADLEDFFDGRTDRLSRIDRDQLHVELEERVASGTISREAGRVRWVSHRGRVLEEGDGRGEPGWVSLLSFDCPDSKRRRIGVWFEPDPIRGDRESPEALTSTVADPAEIAAFIAPLRPCR